MTSLKRSHKNKNGNIFALLFAAVGLTGVLGVVGMQTVSGPVKTITKVTQKNITDTDVITNGRILILNATVRPENNSGHLSYDGDPEFEATPHNTTCSGTPTGGGCLPTTIGTVLTDPWGTNYGYCTWNHGATRTGVADTLDGRTDADGYVIAVISAGPNKTFDTTCAAYDDNATRSADPGGISPAIGSAMRVGMTDDIAKAWSYAEAKANSGGLWSDVGSDVSLADPTGINNIVLATGASVAVSGGSAGVGTFVGLMTNTLEQNASDYVEVVGGLRVDDESEVANGECGAGGTAGILRWNTAGNLEVCDGSAFVNVAAAGGEPVRIRDADGNTQIQVEESLNEDIIRFDTAGAERMTISATGVVDISGATTIGGTLGVDGNVTLGNAGTDIVTLTGDLTVSGDDITMGTNTAGHMLVADGTNFNPVAMSGDAIIDGTGALTIAANAVEGSMVADDTLDFVDFVDAMNLDANTSITADGTEALSIVNTGTGDSFVVMDEAGDTTPFTIDADGNISIGGTLVVSGMATFSDDMTLGNAAVDTIDIGGTLQIGVGSACSTVGDEGKVQYLAGTDEFQVCTGAGGWEAASGTVDKIRDIVNVDISTDPVDGYVLQWDNTAKDWNPVAPSSLTSGSSNDSKKLIDDDGNTQVQVEEGVDDNTIRFDTAGTERMVISSGGNIGIGTNNPASTLHLSQFGSAIRINAAGNPSTPLIFDGMDSGNRTSQIRWQLSNGAHIASIEGYKGFSAVPSHIRLKERAIVGSGIIDSSAKFEVRATGAGFLPPRMTTTQRNAINSGTFAKGLMIYNSSLNEMQFYDNTKWVSMNAENATVGSDILDWDKFTDTMSLDATTTIDMDTNAADLNFDSDTFVIDSSANSVGIGTNAPDSDAILDLTSTALGFLPPRMTTAQRDAITTPTTGLVLYNTTDNYVQYYNGTAWQNASAAGGLAINDLSDAFHDPTTDFNGDTIDNDDNLAIGHTFVTLDATNPGAANTAIGATALDAVTTGDFNVAIGYNALTAASNVSRSTVIGAGAAREWNDPDPIIAIGAGASGTLDIGERVIAIGNNTLQGGYQSARDIAIGHDAMASVEGSTSGNIVIGDKALKDSRGAASNIIIGERSGTTNDSTSYRLGENIAIGGYTLTGKGVKNRNIVIGFGAGNALTTGDNNIIIGRGAQASTTTSSNELNIGGVIYGDRITDRIGIGAMPASGVELDVTGDIQYTGTITDVSDRRLKTDIHELSSDDLIAKFSKIKTYEFKMKDDAEGRVEYGVMAQELEKLFPELVHTADNEMGTKSVNYMGLIAPMIEMSKALKAENNMLKADLVSLKSDTDIIKAQIQTLNKSALGTVRGASISPIIMILFGFVGGGLLMWIVTQRLSRKL